METRRLGQSDLEITVIAFGAWAIGGWMWGGADAGAGNPAQVLENTGAAGFRLSDEEIKIINTYISEIKIDTKI